MRESKSRKAIRASVPKLGGFAIRQFDVLDLREAEIARHVERTPVRVDDLRVRKALTRSFEHESDLLVRVPARADGHGGNGRECLSS